MKQLVPRSEDCYSVLALQLKTLGLDKTTPIHNTECTVEQYNNYEWTLIMDWEDYTIDIFHNWELGR